MSLAQTLCRRKQSQVCFGKCVVPMYVCDVSLRSNESLGAVFLAMDSGASMFLQWWVPVLTTAEQWLGVYDFKMLGKVVKALISRKCWEVVQYGRRTTLSRGSSSFPLWGWREGHTSWGQRTEKEDSGHFQRGRLSPQAKAKELQVVEIPESASRERGGKEWGRLTCFTFLPLGSLNFPKKITVMLEGRWF